MDEFQVHSVKGDIHLYSNYETQKKARNSDSDTFWGGNSIGKGQTRVLSKVQICVLSGGLMDIYLFTIL